MNLIKSYFIIFSCVLLTAACTPKEHQDKITFLEIVQGQKAFMTAFKQGDFNQLAQLYATGGQLFPANNDVVEGDQNIASFWRGLMGLGVTSVKLKTVEVEGTSERVHEVGRYTIHADTGEIIDFGKYLVIWKKQDGQWKLYRHIWTTSMTRQQGLKT